MKILYQSDITGKTYETEEALIEAENKVSEEKKAAELKKIQRAEDAKAVQEKIDKAMEARKEMNAAISEFCEKHGAFKTTFTSDMFSKAFWDTIIDALMF